MYLVTIQVPIYQAGPRRLLATDWRRSLVLLRDSLEGRFGPLAVVAPTLPAELASSAQALQPVCERNDGIRLIGSFDKRCRSGQYWFGRRRQWIDDLNRLMPSAQVVHAGLDDLYRPIAFDGFRQALRWGRPTVFVQDTDIALQTRQLAEGGPVRRRLRAAGYAWMFERLCRRGVARADLSLLKGSTLLRRYGRFAKNPKPFHDTSYLRNEILPAEALEKRLQARDSRAPLRLVYCGRLLPRKGLDHSLAIVHRARELGRDVRLDLIGDGEQRAALEHQIQELRLSEQVRLVGPMEYGRELFDRLAGYDAMLFTPLGEDTPRMIFDGYAAGLPLVAYDIDYVKERAEEEQAAWLLPAGQIEAAGHRLAGLDEASLRRLSLAALSAADYHAADNWYRRRSTASKVHCARRRYQLSAAW